jgi:phage baseplate assembly protein gpV
VTTGAPPQSLPNLACPGGGYFPDANITGTGITYNAATGKLTVSGGSSVATLTGPPYTMYFSEVVLSGGSTLNISAGANHVDLYCAGKLDISGGTMVNPNAKPALLNLAACGAGTNDWKISGGSDAYFTVYAPTRDVTLSGTSPLFGAVVADTVTDSGGSMIHYDTSLNSTGLAAVANSWTEVYK